MEAPSCGNTGVLSILDKHTPVGHYNLGHLFDFYTFVPDVVSYK